MQIKKCKCCLKEKSISEFYISHNNADGYRSKCKACMKEYENRNKDRIKENQKLYRMKNYIKCRESNKQYRNSPAKFNIFFKKIHRIEIYQRDPNNPELIQIRCKYCNSWFNPSYSQLDSRVKAINGNKRSNNLYCSNGCKHACPIYRKIKYPKDFKPATSREVQPELRKMVLERDNWTCQKCNESKSVNPELELHCHHVFPLNEDPVESADMDNCMTLCKDCHKEVHMSVPGCNYSDLKCSN